MKSVSLQNNQSGNILIYILGAIFLIGTLTIMVKGSSTPGAGIDEETLMIRASEVQDYGRELESAVSYVFQNGHSEADIRFAHPTAASAYGTITDIPTRQIFHVDGGGATYRTPPTSIQSTPTNWIFNAANNIPQVGSDDNDLLAILPNVTEAFCILINEISDINNPSDAPPADPNNFDVTTIFDGSFTGANDIGTAVLNGAKMEGCLEGGGTPAADTYHYYRVLLPR